MRLSREARLRELNNLRELNLGNSGVSNEGVGMLQTALPSLHTEYVPWP